MRAAIGARPSGRHRQRGASLVEALLAFLVLSLGLVGIAKLHGQLRLTADLARQRSEALRFAQTDIESLRAFTTLASDPSGHGYADIVGHAASPAASSAWPSNTSFEIARDVHAADGYRSAALTVRWLDRTGQAQQVKLQSVIAGTPPALSGALAAQAPGHTLPQLRGRSAAIPPSATSLGNGRSVFKPAGSGSAAWVFDDASGDIVARCSAAGQVQAATPSDLAGCTPMHALLLSGIVRLSLAGAADAAHAKDTPLPLNVLLTLTSGSGVPPPVCLAEAQKLVAIPTASGSRREAVPLAATPADWGVAGWTELDDRFVAYHCAVTPLQGSWSGRTAIVPQGWSIGSTAAEFKVCRYSADHDGSGAVDQNAEHPNEYHHVDRALMQQNFLLVPGHLACPNTSPVTSGPSAPVHADLSTVQHQP
jgi:Tfp pilus assembly protein PilV